MELGIRLPNDDVVTYLVPREALVGEVLARVAAELEIPPSHAHTLLLEDAMTGAILSRPDASLEAAFGGRTKAALVVHAGAHAAPPQLSLGRLKGISPSSAPHSARTGARPSLDAETRLQEQSQSHDDDGSAVATPVDSSSSGPATTTDIPSGAVTIAVVSIARRLVTILNKAIADLAALDDAAARSSSGSSDSAAVAAAALISYVCSQRAAETSARGFSSLRAWESAATACTLATTSLMDGAINGGTGAADAYLRVSGAFHAVKQLRAVEATWLTELQRRDLLTMWMVLSSSSSSNSFLPSSAASPVSAAPAPSSSRSTPSDQRAAPVHASAAAAPAAASGAVLPPPPLPRAVDVAAAGAPSSVARRNGDVPATIGSHGKSSSLTSSTSAGVASSAAAAASAAVPVVLQQQIISSLAQPLPVCNSLISSGGSGGASSSSNADSSTTAAGAAARWAASSASREPSWVSRFHAADRAVHDVADDGSESDEGDKRAGAAVATLSTVLALGVAVIGTASVAYVLWRRMRRRRGP